jgi:hypothetical protein
MTKERTALPARVVAEQKPFFIPLGEPQPMIAPLFGMRKERGVLPERERLLNRNHFSSPWWA